MSDSTDARGRPRSFASRPPPDRPWVSELERVTAQLSAALRRAGPPPPASTSWWPTSPCVYFVQAGHHGPVKVGYASDLRARFAALQTGNHEELALLGAMPGTPDDERAVQAKLAAFRIRGEWFDGMVRRMGGRVGTRRARNPGNPRKR